MDLSLLIGGCIAFVLGVLHQWGSDSDGDNFVGWLLIITGIVLISVSL